MRTTRETAVAIRTEHLIARYRGVICDLDSVVYWGTAAVPGAVDTLNHVVADGRAVAFATNNASRSPIAVAKHLRELGVGGRGWSVITSSQAAAAYLAERLDPGAPVLAVGGPGVAVALAEAGLAPVRVSELADTQVEAMVQGLGVDVTWRELAEVGYLAQRGVTWVATNLDLFLPTARGPAPGNGALVAAVRTTTTRTPHVTGKPGAALFELARTRLGTHHARTWRSPRRQPARRTSPPTSPDSSSPDSALTPCRTTWLSSRARAPCTSGPTATAAACCSPWSPRRGPHSTTVAWSVRTLRSGGTSNNSSASSAVRRQKRSQWWSWPRNLLNRCRWAWWFEAPV